MNKLTLQSWLLAWAMGSCLAVQSAVIRFEQTSYFAQANEAITVRLIYDADVSIEGDQLPEQGFFSIGAALLFPGGMMSTAEEAVQLPMALDSDGVGNPPLKEVTATRAGAAGAVDVLAGGSPHTNTLFLTITLTNLAASGSYPLSGELYLAAPFNNFISGIGEPLDGSITQWGTSMVYVLPGFPSPVISSLTSLSSNQWNLSFTDPNGVPEVYQIERTADLNSPIQWEPVPQVNLQETLPGIFEAVFTDTFPVRYYRIKVLYPVAAP